MALNSETLTYWYFRLNGFFTIPNFVVHPDHGSKQLTEIDVLGIRLPHRRELLQDSMVDDDIFTRVSHKAFIAIVEVKRDKITFNRTWREKALGNVERFLYAAGAFLPANVDAIANSIYETGYCAIDRSFHVSLIGIGRRENQTFRRQYPCVPQITWKHIGEFVFSRFRRYQDQKKNHEQWDDAGQKLWNLWVNNRNDVGKFCNSLAKIIEMP